MVALDTNILFPWLRPEHANHIKATAYVDSIRDNEDVVISELLLAELYGLLRNPAVMTKPMSARDATDVCQDLRNHPKWRIMGFPPDSKAFHDAFWPKLAEPDFARRKAFDWRTALSLLMQGVEEFATVNVKDFEGLGFKRVFNPLEGDSTESP